MATQPSNIPLLPAPQDYTAADFETCLTALQQAVNTAFPKWTDFNRASVGNVILRAFCTILDLLSKYQNDQALENFLVTVRRRRNMIALASGVGVALKGISAGSADLTFTLAAAGANDVVIPAGTRVSTTGENPIAFFTTADLRITAGNTVGTVSARAADPQSETPTSDGAANQTKRLQFAPFVDGSDLVTVGTDTWLRVPTFLFSTPTSKHYMVQVDETNRATLFFGNGINGAVPPIGQYGVTYETGGGTRTNVSIGSITELAGVISDVLGSPVSITVTNAAASSGGSDRETVEQARRRIPGQLRALTRTVAREDFELNALAVPGVARAMMLTKDEDPAVGDNEGELVIIPTGGGLPSTTLKDQVLVQVTETFPTMITFGVSVVDPAYETINITAQVKVKNGFTLAQVTANINAALDAYFALLDAEGSPNTRVDFGANLVDNLIPFSDLLAVVGGAAGVSRVEEDTFVPANDVVLGLREFPEKGTVTITAL